MNMLSLDGDWGGGYNAYQQATHTSGPVQIHARSQGLAQVQGPPPTYGDAGQFELNDQPAMRNGGHMDMGREKRDMGQVGGVGRMGESQMGVQDGQRGHVVAQPDGSQVYVLYD